MHRWAGLVSSWAIYTMTLTGTLAVFDTELTRWMQPQTATVPARSMATPAALEQARQMLAQDDANGLPPAFLRLPGPRDPTLRIERFDGHAFSGPVLDPRDGHVITAPRTEGGTFFFDLHYSLRVPRPWGQRLVAAFTFVFAIELLGGILIHLARVIPDYFTLRLRAALPRFLLDVHVLTGTAVLPFHVMVTYTGLILAAGNALPVLGRAGETPPPRPTVAAHWAPTTPLAPLLEQTRALSGHEPEHLRFSPGQVAVFATRPGSLALDRVSIPFDATTGRVLGPPAGPGAPRPDLAQQATALAHGLHMGRTMEPTLRWFWFVGGLASTAMVATGLLFYTARRRASAASGPAVVFERLNAGVLTGLPCACLVYLYLNRLAPPAGPAWPNVEVGGFFATWLGCVVLSSLVAPRQGWRAILAGIALMGLATPVLDMATAPDARAEFSTSFGLFAGVDGLCMLAGIVAGAIAVYGPRLGRARHGKNRQGHAPAPAEASHKKAGP
nr:PepSY-associated TM helix domain-containing protein [Acetobacter garciniae]